MRSAALVFFCFLLCGCSTGSSPDAAPEDEVSGQERIWREAGLSSYRFDFQQECFCVPEQVQPVTVEVRDGRVERVVSRATGQEITGDPNLRWYTVAELFEVIARARADQADPVVIRYHPELGYPTHIEIGSLAADAGVIYTASDLTPL